MKGLFVGAVAVAVFFLLLGVAANRPVGAMPDGRKGDANILYNIEKGQGASTIAEGLKDAGLIRSARFFKFTTWSRGTRGDFKAGSFELSPSMSTREIERALTTQEPSRDEIQLTILEGWTIDDIAAYLEEKGIASREEFFAEVGHSAKFVSPGALPAWGVTFDFLADKPAKNSLEGYLFPDTYRIFAESGAKALVRRMLSNFDAKLTPQLRVKIEASGHSIFDVVTMASVIEREVRTEEDMAVVAGIFWKRLDLGMGLQADSTVNYITGDSKPSVSFEETNIDHPWNTYKHRGLPAGPIGNPSLRALEAAIRPKESPYLYFLTDPSGKVHYGRTLEEHNANRAYLR